DKRSTEDNAGAPPHVERVAGLIRDHSDAALGHRPVRIHGWLVHAPREGPEPLSSSRTRETERASAVGRKLEQPRDPPRAEYPSCTAEREVERSRERGSHRRLGDRQIAGGDLWRVDLDWESDRLAPQPGEGAHDRIGGRMAVENPPGSTGDDHRIQSVEDDRGIAVRSVDAGRNLVELVLERRIVDLRWRSDV